MIYIGEMTRVFTKLTNISNIIMREESFFAVSPSGWQNEWGDFSTRPIVAKSRR